MVDRTIHEFFITNLFLTTFEKNYFLSFIVNVS
jgi:hypothetical protein